MAKHVKPKNPPPKDPNKPKYVPVPPPPGTHRRTPLRTKLVPLTCVPEDTKRVFLGIVFDETSAILRRIEAFLRTGPDWAASMPALAMKLRVLDTISRLAEGEQKAIIEEEKRRIDEKRLEAEKSASKGGGVPNDPAITDLWAERLKRAESAK